MSIGSVAPGAPVFNGDRNAKKIALTFDDGPNGEFTDGVLEALKDHVVTGLHGEQYHVDAPATFFEIGQQAADDPARVRAIRDAGHAIGVHTWDHSDLTTLSNEQVARELSSTSQAIHDATGEWPTMFRAPYGSHSQRVDDIAAGQGLRDILWDVDTEDWKLPGVGSIVATGDQAREGSIVLMHDGGGNRAQTVQAVRQLVDRLIGEGYQLVTVPELLADRQPS